MRFLMCLVVLAVFSIQTLAQIDSSEEAKSVSRWVDSWLNKIQGADNGALGKPRNPPVSFLVDGKPVRDAADDFQISPVQVRNITHATKNIVTYTSKSLALECRLECVLYDDSPAAEWILYIKNTGATDSPILSEIYPLDMALEPSAKGFYTLHHAKGSHNEQTDFQPFTSTLEPAKILRLVSYGGRSSDGALPFFNAASANDGVIFGIGWTGQWAANFEPQTDCALHITAGMEKTHLRLHPGESIRTPSILMLYWKGNDWLRGQNLLRQLIRKHYTPQQNDTFVMPPVAASPHGNIGFNDTTETNLIELLNRVVDHKLPVDTYWLDAGWQLGGFPLGMGNPDPDPKRFPNGLKPVSDAAHAKGLKYLQWFEPERVMRGTALDKDHPDWLLQPADLPQELMYHEKDGFRLLNFGNKDALAWVTQKISQQIADFGVDIYRQDFNMFPLFYWRNGEPEDRQGMTEIRYIEGLYAFLDALKKDHPNLVIDNCASGGRRLDFEMQRRSLFLWRTDDCWEPIAEQCMTHSLSTWLPVHGVGSISIQPYEFRSGLGSSFSMALDFRSEDPKYWEQATARVKELLAVRDHFSKDYYPLTEYSTAEDARIAWQFWDPTSQKGIVQAFRRAKAGDGPLHVTLHGLQPNIAYSITNQDTGERISATGGDLMTKGFDIAIKDAPGSALFVYTRQ